MTSLNVIVCLVNEKEESFLFKLKSDFMKAYPVVKSVR